MNKVVSVVVVALVFFYCVAGEYFGDKKTISYDIHMKVNTETSHFVEDQLEPLVSKLLPHNDLNFSRTIPHITLYMTTFLRQYQDEIVVSFKQTAAKLLEQYPDCTVTMRAAAASGSYYLWHASIPPCLQAMSDAFVENLSPYRDLNQTIPKWLFDIPEPERSEMIKLDEMYGSPSVMSYFDPHITIAWDDQEPMTPLDKLDLPELNITVGEFAIGVTTAHGAVLKNRDLAAYPSSE